MVSLGSWPDEPSMRAWQLECFAKFEQVRRARIDFFLVATPGAGKTRALLRCAHQLLLEGSAQRIVVVCHTRHLCEQWAKVAAEVGIQINPEWQNTDPGESASFHGVAVTYQQVASNPQVHRLPCRRPSVVILDEIHHVKDGPGTGWGPAIREAFEKAAFRLSASGTPFRSDNSPIPFVPYEEGVSRGDYVYRYRDALSDDVCRMVFFPSYEGRMEWYSDGDTEKATFRDELGERLAAERLNTALDARGEWLHTVLRDANQDMTAQRADGHCDAGSLCIARDQRHARDIAALLMKTTGVPPLLAMTDEPESSANIEAFKNGRQRWLVAVRMVSEGVDIPRLRNVVYATNVTSELFFRQAVGRVVRVVPGLEEQCAKFYIPRDKRLIEFAEQVMKERDHQLMEQIERMQKRELLLDLEWEKNRRVFMPIGSEAIPDDGIIAGEIFAQNELAAAERVRAAAGVRSPVAEIALILRAHEALAVPPAVSVSPLAPELGQPTQPRLTYQRMKELKGLCNRMAARYAAMIGIEIRDVHTEWLKIGGLPQKQETLEGLEKKKDWLYELIQRREQME